MIPSLKLGDVVFSATHTTFAAALMADVGRELVGITAKLDRGVEYNRVGDPEYVLSQVLSVDIPAMVAAAHYCHWISDHLRYEVAHWGRFDLSAAEDVAVRYFENPDHAALYRLEQQQFGAEEQPPWERPPFPATLREMHQARRQDRFSQAGAILNAKTISELAEAVENGYARRLEGIRETLNEASTATLQSKTRNIEVIGQHISALAEWAAGQPKRAGHTDS